MGPQRKDGRGGEGKGEERKEGMGGKGGFPKSPPSKKILDPPLIILWRHLNATEAFTCC